MAVIGIKYFYRGRQKMSFYMKVIVISVTNYTLMASAILKSFFTSGTGVILVFLYDVQEVKHL